MSDWHFGMDYDMWLYPQVDFMAPDYDYELPEPIEAANIEGTLLVNAYDAIEQVRRLIAENAKLRELVRIAIKYCDSSTCDGCPIQGESGSCPYWDMARELGVEVDG